ncbi:MAG: CAP domain-containing protein [Devosia sp.]|uniref:CAP domain-containing protein n=1 Tax=Devosia sp. TaxID=1871048 RepID=UPI001AC3DE13|nr:CAP domain-containing protein [Devosia sp.]MBN9316864.1 CAP domain-containing protein [Devosia sp.]
MPRLRTGFIILATTTLLAACTSVVPPAPGPGKTATTPPVQLTQGGILSAINNTRAANGKPPLRYNVKLEDAARSQANLMAAKDTLSHDLGVTLRQRVTTAGYDGAVGENVAGGQSSLDQAIAGWLASPAHRDTLLSTKFQEFGLAVATVPPNRDSRYRTYWAFIAGGPFDAWR